MDGKEACGKMSTAWAIRETHIGTTVGHNHTPAKAARESPTGIPRAGEGAEPQGSPGCWWKSSFVTSYPGAHTPPIWLSTPALRYLPKRKGNLGSHNTSM